MTEQGINLNPTGLGPSFGITLLLSLPSEGPKESGFQNIHTTYEENTNTLKNVFYFFIT